jgi:Uma2 family endonuclease
MPQTAYLEHYTADDYAHWEGNWELIYGAPYAMSPSPSITHQRLAKRLLIMLDRELEACSLCEVLSEVDWHCADDIIVRPDIVLACDVQGEKLVQTPEMIIEIVSPSTRKRDEQIKHVLYQEKGVRIYILIYPEEQKVAIYQLVEGKYQQLRGKKEEISAFQVQHCTVRLAFDQIWQG